jgi:hypothetical protein
MTAGFLSDEEEWIVLPSQFSWVALLLVKGYCVTFELGL